jgi:hypothetical protein
MPEALELLREGRKRELWEKCCSFIDLNIEQFMAIQRRLLMEQIELLTNCELGRKVMRGARPRSVEEFRIQVPITTYADYADCLLEQKEDALPEKPRLWQHTSGRSSEYVYKWCPVTERVYREIGDFMLAVLILSSCSERGEVVLEEHDKLLYGLAPPPYASGALAHRAAEEGVFDFLPPIHEAENMEFQKRVELGFRMGMSEGIDLMAGISVMLITIGERFSQGGGLKRIIPLVTKPKLFSRLSRAWVKSKLAGRPMLPRDIWTLKGLISIGADATVYRQRIKDMWGRYPLEIYGATEPVVIAVQMWDYGDMTFLPNLNFLEFIPEKEYAKWFADRAYQPRTLLLDEVIPGEKYVIVITNFLGGPFVRYVLGDMIQITSLRNAKLNINIPQMTYYSRADNVLDFGGASLTEKAIWQAIEDSGLDYVDWVARKETQDGLRLHLYVELKSEGQDENKVTSIMDKQFRLMKEDYVHMVEEMGFKLLKVTLLPSGAFQQYRVRQEASGADMTHLRPPHINPSDDVLAVLMKSEGKMPVGV